MATGRANHPNLLAVGFRKVFYDNYRRYPEEYSKIFNVDTSTKAFEEDTGLTGFGMVPEKPEGSAILYDDPLTGYNKKYVHTTYAMGFQVTMEMLQDDQYRKMQQMPKALGFSLATTIETDGADILNNGFTDTGPDGESLFDTAHPLIGGGTNSNRQTTALTETSLEQALYDISEWTDDRGLKIMCRPTRLIIPSKLEFKAMKLLQSSYVPALTTGLSAEGSGITGGNDVNDINPLQGRLQPVIMHYLTDVTDWYVQCDMHGLNWFWRMRPSFDQDGDFDTKNSRYSVIARWSKGYTDWRGMYGAIVAG